MIALLSYLLVVVLYVLGLVDAMQAFALQAIIYSWFQLSSKHQEMMVAVGLFFLLQAFGVFSIGIAFWALTGTGIGIGLIQVLGSFIQTKWAQHHAKKK